MTTHTNVLLDLEGEADVQEFLRFEKELKEAQQQDRERPPLVPGDGIEEAPVRALDPSSVAYETMKVRACEHSLVLLCTELTEVEAALELAVLGIEGSGALRGSASGPVHVELVDQLCLRDVAAELVERAARVSAKAHALADAQPRHPVETRAENLPLDLPSVLLVRQQQQQLEQQVVRTGRTASQQRKMRHLGNYCDTDKPVSPSSSPLSSSSFSCSSSSPSSSQMLQQDEGTGQATSREHATQQLNATPSASPKSSVLGGRASNIGGLKSFTDVEEESDSTGTSSSLSSARSLRPPPAPPAYVYASIEGSDESRDNSSGGGDRQRIEGDLGGLRSSVLSSELVGPRFGRDMTQGRGRGHPGTVEPSAAAITTSEQVGRGVRFGDGGAGRMAMGGVLVAVAPGSRPASAAQQARQTTSRQAARSTSKQAVAASSVVAATADGDAAAERAPRPFTTAADLAGGRNQWLRGSPSSSSYPRVPSPKSAAEEEANFWNAAEATAKEMKAAEEVEFGSNQHDEVQHRSRPNTADYRSSLLAQQRQLIDEAHALQRPRSKFRNNRIGL
jgi:hypothetical protein